MTRPSTFFHSARGFVKISKHQKIINRLPAHARARPRPPYRARALRGMSDAARETLDVAHDVAKLLDTGLDREQLAVLIALVERGVNPEALAAVVRELRREAAALKSEER